MESKHRWLFWVIFSIVSLSLVIGLFLYARSGQVTLDVLKKQIIVAVLAAAFLFLTLDRLKEMNGRIERMESRVATFWQEVFKEIDDLASNQVKTALNALQEKARSEFKVLNESIKKLTSQNKWLQEVDPNDLALYSKHLEPIFASAESLLRGGKRDIARKLINEALDDPEVKGTPNDYHNIGVLAANSLNDDLLAMRVYEIYLEKVEEPNADVLADALQVCTRSENWHKANEYAETIQKYLGSNDPRFIRKWRPWVFLADYYLAGSSSFRVEFPLKPVPRYPQDQ